MAYVNVAEWSPDQVAEWLKGKTGAGASVQQVCAGGEGRRGVHRGGMEGTRTGKGQC